MCIHKKSIVLYSCSVITLAAHVLYSYSCSRHYLHYYFLIFQLCQAACGLLVHQPWIKPVPPEMEEQSLNHHTARVPLRYI